MGKSSPLQSSFVRGEISPLTQGRVDSEAYKTGLNVCKNYIPVFQGPIVRRPGSRFVAEVADSTKFTILKLFKFSTVQSYIIEFGNQTIRFYRNGGQIVETAKTITGITNANPGVVTTSAAHGYSNGDEVFIKGVVGMTEVNNLNFLIANVTATTFELQDKAAVNINTTSFGTYSSAGTSEKVFEISSTYLESELDGLEFVQSADVLFIVHENHAPAELSRTDHTAWTLTDTAFFDGPYLDENTTATTVQPNATKVGDTVTLTSVPALFVSTDVGRKIRIKTTQPLQVIVSASNANPGVFTITAHGYSTGFEVLIENMAGMTDLNNQKFTVVVLTVDTFNLKDLSGNLIDANGFGIYVGSSGTAKRTLEINSGTVNITGFTSSTVVTGTIIKTLGGVTTTTKFRLGLWHDGDIFPSTVVFHQQRLVYTTLDRIDFSVPGDFVNFEPDTTDEAGVQTITDSSAISGFFQSEGVHEAIGVVSEERSLVVRTVDGEWSITPSSLGEALTPSNINSVQTSSYGSKDNVPAKKAGKAIIFMQAGGRILREMLFYESVAGFDSVNLSLISDQITETGIVDMVYQQKPHSIVWCLRSDGQLLAATYLRNREFLQVGWSRHIVGGASDDAQSDAIIESIEVIDSVDGFFDELWYIVQRRIDGRSVRYVEHFTQFFDDEVEQEDAFFVDSGLTFDSPVTITNASQADPVVITATAHGFSNGDKVKITEVKGMTDLNGETFLVSNKAANTFEIQNLELGTDIDGTGFTAYISGGIVRKFVTIISALNHLEGETVSILGDGAAQIDQVVTGGKITLDFRATVVQIGYKYNSDAQLLRVESGAPEGTAVGRKRRVYLLNLLVERTLGLFFGTDFNNLDEVTFRTSSDLSSRPTSLFSGIIQESIEADFDLNNGISFRQNQPLPGTIQAAGLKMTTSNK